MWILRDSLCLQVCIALLAVYGRVTFALKYTGQLFDALSSGPLLCCYSRCRDYVFLTMVSVSGRYFVSEASSKRGAGFMPAVVGESWTSGLVIFIAIKALAGGRIPY